MSLIEYGSDVIIEIIRTLSYPGIVFLMALESACLPVPSEIVMPFAGVLASDAFGDPVFSLWGVTAAGTIGNLLGAIFAYWVGMRAGRPIILKYGRYFLIREKHLNWAEDWFAKYGDPAIFFSRMLPVVRTFISLPAGMARMRFGKFVALTTLGSIPWNFGLAYIGYILGDNWRSILDLFEKLDIIIIVAIVVIVIWLAWIYLKNNKDEKSESHDPPQEKE